MWPDFNLNHSQRTEGIFIFIDQKKVKITFRKLTTKL